ncbi:MAG: hypothetical protein U0520_00380 [Candidatus Saccharimonadales bacterium]
MLGIILLIATAGLPLVVIYWYQTCILKSGYSWRRNDLLVPLLAAGVQFAASTIPYYFLDRLPANFLHHAIGGGVVVAIMTAYVISRLWPRLILWPRFFLLFSVVNILGNVNEIAELIGELTTRHVYISTKLDTNIDLVANNVGAFVGFLCILLILNVMAKRRAR